jgi:hypothetical protein
MPASVACVAGVEKSTGRARPNRISLPVAMFDMMISLTSQAR